MIDNPDPVEARTDEVTADSHQSQESLFRTWIGRICVLGVLLWAGFFFALLLYQSLYGEMAPKNWFMQMVQQHPAATIGLGISAISAFFIVSVLELTTGPARFEVLGFKFQGTASQVILWVLCFLSMIFAVWLLWHDN
jgi:hypothetical protein